MPTIQAQHQISGQHRCIHTLATTPQAFIESQRYTKHQGWGPWYNIGSKFKIQLLGLQHLRPHMSIPMTKFWRFPVKNRKTSSRLGPGKHWQLTQQRPSNALVWTENIQKLQASHEYVLYIWNHIMTCSWFNTNIDSCVLSVSKSDWIFFAPWIPDDAVFFRRCLPGF